MVLGSSLNFPDDIVFFFSHPYLLSFFFKTYISELGRKSREITCVYVGVGMGVCAQRTLAHMHFRRMIVIEIDMSSPSLQQNTSPEGWEEQSHPQRRVGRVGVHVQPLIPVAPARAHKPSYHPLALGHQGRRCLESSRQG